MKAMSWLRARPRTIAAAAVVTAAAVGITTMAFAYEGNPTTEVDLHDGSVWITKSSSLMVGHFNHESQLLDGGVRTTSDQFDIRQDGETVLVVDEQEHTVSSVDPASVTIGESSNVGNSEVELGGPAVAVLDRQSGQLWVTPAAAMGSFDVKQAEPLAELGADADVTVAPDGTVYAVSSEKGEIVTVPVDAEGRPADPQTQQLEGTEGAKPTIAAVGTTPVVLAGGTLLTPDGVATDIPQPDGAVLQQASANADAAYVATSRALVAVPLNGDEPTVVEPEGDAEGVPAAPVSLNGCAYGAWAGSAQFVRDCIGEGDDLTTAIEGVDRIGELRFRVNRDVVMLNDLVEGTAWLASESMKRVDNWDDLTPPEGESEDQEDDSTEETIETTLPQRSEENTDPVARDDSYGVRAGRTTVLPVLDNDTDADGDVLTITLPDGSPSLGEVQPIHNGASLQIAVPEDAGGTSTFQYEVSDGRGGEARASVTLEVHPDSVNAPPEQKREQTIAVETGGTVTYNVLPDWIDPDGDDIYLEAVYPADGDEADFTPDGRITYRAVSGNQGLVEAEIVLSDGKDSTTGTLQLEVRPVGSTPPVTNADHVVVRPGQTATVTPLANDTSAGTEPLRLTRVEEVSGATIEPDFADKSFTFVSDAPGTYYVPYSASTGPNSVPGIVRVDVLDSTESELPPVAVRDVALVPAGGEALVNVLANDMDPAGGILVVQSVTADQSSGLSVSVLNHESLRISDRAALSEQTTIQYSISNGSESVTGEVVVIPVPAPEKLRPPVANDDEVVVRAGDVVDIPVLDNDYHPNDDAMHVAPDLVPPIVDEADGEIFVSQDTVRFRAGDEAKTVYATYEAVDSSGQKDAGYITIQILPVNEETNSAPQPKDLTARALSGSEAQIPVPLDGIDQDGDSVELIGLASAPKKGSIVETEADHFVYEAFDDASGVDTFTYRVRDRLGAEGTASVRVGVAPADSANQAPYAVKDSVVVRPGRQVAVPVMANDSDPEGDQIGLVPNGLVLPDDVELGAEVVGNRVVVDAPDTPTETSLQYKIADERDATASGVLQVTVSEDVPLQRPVARDDTVLVEDVTEDLTADIEVLANDEDPDGTTDALELEVPGAQVLDDGTVRVEIGEEKQLITYTVTDEDGQEASAFLRVPAIRDLRPSLSSNGGIEVVSGETRDVQLSEHVTVAGGGDAVITEAAKVTAAHSNGESLVKDQGTLTYTSADGYYGQDAITFEVTDGTGPDDPEGRKATLTLPVTVLPPDNRPPTFTDGSMSVGAGDDPATLDLATLTEDPDPGDIDGMTYELAGGSPEGLNASIDGSTLQVAADPDTRGSAESLQVRVSDGETDPVTGTVNVNVTSSNRPLPTANDDVLPEANQGETVSVPVLDNDFNPFPETPLNIESATVETGQGDAQVDGDQVAVTPDGEFVGTMVVRYRIADATDDPQRQVEGRIELTVQGAPEAPGRPTVTSVQDRTVVMRWTPPADNGAEITEYQVRSLSGDYEQTCQATTCTLGGLTNNVTYQFEVVAVNRVGPSEPSRPSEEARPDVRPDPPQAPSLTFGDRSLQVDWQRPESAGSPVESYTLEISPAPPSGIAQKTEVTGESFRWEGLENGVPYQIRVRAHNLAPEPSSWSPWSASEVPAAPPGKVGTPTTSHLDSVGNQAQMEVAWGAPANNGDAIDKHVLEVSRGGQVVERIDVPAGQTSQAVTVQTSQTDYEFRVRSRNKAGWGAWSDPASRHAYGAPGAPGTPNANPGDGQVSVSWSEPSELNGNRAGDLDYQFSLNGGEWSNSWASRDRTSGTIGGLSNGTEYTVRVRAVVAGSGPGFTGAASAGSNTVIPFGPPHAPSVNATRAGDNTDIRFTWKPPSENGRSIDKMEIRIDGGWEAVPLSGSRTNDYGYSETHSIEARVTDSEGNTSSVASDKATTRAEPKPSATVSKGRHENVSTCTSQYCAHLDLSYKNFPSGTYQVTCRSGHPTAGNDGTIGSSASYRLSGNNKQELSCIWGEPKSQVWADVRGPNGISFSTPKYNWY